VLPGIVDRPFLLPNLDARTMLRETMAVLRHQPGALWLADWSLSPAGPLGPGELAQPARDYSAMAARDIFIGPPLQDGAKPAWISARYTTLNLVSSDDRRTEISLYDLWNNKHHKKLRTTSGFDMIPLVKDSQGNTVAHAAVVQIDVECKEVVLRIQLMAEGAPLSAQMRTEMRDRFFHLDLEKLDKFQKDRDKIKVEEWESLARDQALRAQFGDQVLRVDRQYWESLVKDKIVTFTESDGRFQLDLPASQISPGAVPGGGFAGTGGGAGLGGEEGPVQALKGKVIRGPGPDWYLITDERYCALHMGQSLESALKKPMTESQVKELKTAAAGGGGGGIAP
jgi:hypothetical protein